MLLHDSMDDAVAHIRADLPALATASRRRGLSIRRRRHALTSVGAVAAAAVIAAGVWSVEPGGGGREGTVATDPPALTHPGRERSIGPQALSGATAPITARGVAAALAGAIDAVADGTFARFQGDVYDAYGHEADGSLLFRPGTGAGPAGQVMINLQPLKTVDGPPYTCGETYMTGCAVRTLADGDTLRTYREDGDTEFGADSQRAVAEVLSPARRLRVVVFAMNTSPWSKRTYRDRTVLDIGQLSTIATQPWWSRTQLPREYVEAGKRLKHFS